MKLQLVTAIASLGLLLSSGARADDPPADLGGLKVGKTVQFNERVKLKDLSGDERVFGEMFEEGQVSAIQLISLDALMVEARKAKDEWLQEKKQSALPSALRDFHAAYELHKGKDVKWILIAECMPGQAMLDEQDRSNKLDTFLEEQGLSDVTLLIDEGRQVRSQLGIMGNPDMPGKAQGQQEKGSNPQGMEQHEGMGIALVTRSPHDACITVKFAGCTGKAYDQNYLARALNEVLKGLEVTSPYGATTVPAGTPREGPDRMPGGTGSR